MTFSSLPITRRNRLMGLHPFVLTALLQYMLLLPFDIELVLGIFKSLDAISARISYKRKGGNISWLKTTKPQC